MRVLSPVSLTALCTLSACTSGTAPSSTVSPLDTAILFPLPETTASSTLLRAASADAHGALLPEYAWNAEAFPANLGSTSHTSELIPRLVVVAANLDPCFPDATVPDAQCRNQVRLVMQPLRDDGSRATTDDVSLHTFYDLPRSELTALFREILRLDATLDAETRAEVETGPLSIHPAMRREGPGGPFAAAIQRAFLKYCGADRLTKVTYSALRGTGMGWQMGGIDLTGTTATRITVAEANAFRQELINNDTGGTNFLISVDPPTTFSRGLAGLVDTARLTPGQPASDAVRAAYATALRIDNPDRGTHPGNVDCASCHIATPLRLWAERNQGLTQDTFAERFTSTRWDLSLESETQTNTLSTRCFGYYGRSVAISMRTVNEAAAVADYVNARLLNP